MAKIEVGKKFASENSLVDIPDKAKLIYLGEEEKSFVFRPEHGVENIRFPKSRCKVEQDGVLKIPAWLHAKLFTNEGELRPLLSRQRQGDYGL